SAGVYSLSGPSWTSNSETFTLNATYNGVTISKVYTITKSLAGADAEIYELKINPTNLVRGRDGALSPSYLTLSATKTVGNGTPEDYVGLFEIYEDGVINPNGPFSPVSPATSINYTPTASTVKQIQVKLYNGAVLLDSQSAVVVDDATGGNLLYTNEWVVDPNVEVTSSSFPHWSPIENLDDGLNNNTIVSVDGPYGNPVIAWKVTALDDMNWASVSSTDFAIDNTKKYRFALWFKKVGTDLEDGSIYIGTKTNGVLALDDEFSEEPLFWSYFTETDSFNLNEWHLLIAYIHPWMGGIVPQDSSSGIYTVEGVKTGLSVTDFKWPNAQEVSNFRFGYGYNNIEQEVYFYAPRVELCDGNEAPLDGFFPALNKFIFLQELFQNFEDDKQISPVEKRSLKELWNLISSDYIKIFSEAADTDITTLSLENFKNAYSALSDYLTVELAIFSNMEEATMLVPNSSLGLTETEYWETTWANYYSEKEKIENLIRDYNLKEFNTQKTLIGEATSAISDAQGDISVIKSYMHYDSEGLTFSKDSSPFQITISNDQIEFIDSGNPVAYINGQKMYIDSLDILTSIILGNHKLEKFDADGKSFTIVNFVG
ncbi:MAG: hypothetical protein RBR68_15200, partial [Tenuifilaceae bacterium]|nr:hypothetical protein [Tenuifilaceae bacterium]